MNRLTDWLVKACNELGLHADVGFLVVLADGHKVHTVARIRDLGDENGMLVVSTYNEVKAYLDEIARSGYGFSVLEEPSAHEIYDLDSHREMFRDWGWSGIETKRPSWL